MRYALLQNVFIIEYLFFFKKKKALTVLRGPLAYPNGLLNLHIETFGKTPWPGDQPDARPLPTQDNTTQKHGDTHPCPKQDSNLRSQCSSGRRQFLNRISYACIISMSRLDERLDTFNL
jgi:hypothetical protein